MLISCGHAFAEKILIISEAEHPYHQEIERLIAKNIIKTGIDVNIQSVNDINTDFSGYSSLVTIGYKAAATIINDNTSKPVLSLLIPKLAFNQLISNIDKKNRFLFSSIYIDQPINRQARLIKYLSPGFKQVGVLYGKHSYSRKSNITAILEQSGLKVNNITVLEKTALISETRYISENSDVLLAIPDNTIFNRRSIKGILLTTYRKRIPVLGYSQAYVKAGALAAVYSTPEHISRQAIEILNKHSQHNYIAATRADPYYYDIAINKKVARSLNIITANKSLLLDQLRASEPDNKPLETTKGLLADD